MENSRARDFMFCRFCGTMLSLTSTKYAECGLCKSRTRAKELLGREIRYTVGAEDMRRELGISQVNEEKMEQKALMVKVKCKFCGHHEQEYTVRQMRSADEGQTTFYRCPKCHKTSFEN